MMNALTHCPHCGNALFEEVKQEAESKPAYPDMPIEAQIMANVPKIYIPKGVKIKNALREHFRLTPNWTTRYNREWLEWAVNVEMTADEIKRAADIWRYDKRFNWQIPNLKGIYEHWLELTSPSQGSILREPRIERLVRDLEVR